MIDRHLYFSDTKKTITYRGVEFPLSDFVDQFSAKSPDLGLLPPVVKMISPVIGSRCLIIVEQKPTVRTVTFMGEPYRIPIPWHHWVFMPTVIGNKLQHGFVSLLFSSSQLQDDEHKFYFPWVTNCRIADVHMHHEPGGLLHLPFVCMSWPSAYDADLRIYGHHIGTEDSFPQPVKPWDRGPTLFSFNDYFNHYVSKFWTDTFNEDYADGLSRWKRPLMNMREGLVLDSDSYDVHRFYAALSDLSVDEAIELLGYRNPVITMDKITKAVDVSESSFTLRALIAAVDTAWVAKNATPVEKDVSWYTHAMAVLRLNRDYIAGVIDPWT